MPIAINGQSVDQLVPLVTDHDSKFNFKFMTDSLSNCVIMVLSYRFALKKNFNDIIETQTIDGRQ